LKKRKTVESDPVEKMDENDNESDDDDEEEEEDEEDVTKGWRSKGQGG
jgi:hypothetical protein